MPGAFHLQVRAQGEVVVEAGEQVLAAGDRAGDGRAGDVAGRQGGIRKSLGQYLSGEALVELVRRRETVSPSGTVLSPSGEGRAGSR